MSDEPDLGGRPEHEYDPVVGAKIVAAVEKSGCGFGTACEMHGLPEATGHAWKAREPGFLRAEKEARAKWRYARALQATESADAGETVMRIYTAKVAHPKEWSDRPPQEGLQLPTDRPVKRLIVELDNDTDSTAR